MKKKIPLITGVFVALFLAGISFYAGLTIGVQRTEKAAQLQVKTILTKLLESDMIDISARTFGTVKEISNRTVVLARFNLEGKESESFPVFIKEGTKIITSFVLPTGAKAEEIKGSINKPDGTTINLGEKEISLQDIKAGDIMVIDLELKSDGGYQGTIVRVSPATITELLK